MARLDSRAFPLKLKGGRACSQSPPTTPTKRTAERGGETSEMPHIAWQTAAAHPDLDPSWTNEG